MSVMFRSVCSAYSPRCRTRDAVAMRPLYAYSFFFLPSFSLDVNFPIPEFIASQRLSLFLQKKKKKTCTLQIQILNVDRERKYKGVIS